MRAYKVYAIGNGTVIDHIPSGCALKVYEILRLNEYDHIVTIGMNLESKKMVRKDILKIENKTLSKDELNKIAVVAPNATINIIRNQQISEKFGVEVPDVIEKIIKCPNPKCITRNQHVETKFYKMADKPIEVKCHYCERVFAEFGLN